MPRAGADGGLPRGLGLPVHGQRRHGILRGVRRAQRQGAVEHVVRGEVHQGGAGPGARRGECSHTRGVDRPGGRPALGALGRVHCREGGRVDHGAVPAQGVPRADLRGPGGRVREVQLRARPRRERQLARGQQLGEGGTHLAAGSQHEDGRGSQRGDVVQRGVRAVLVRELSLRERHGPLDAQPRVTEVHERVLGGGVRAPVVRDQVGVGGRLLERLERVAHAARDEHRGARGDLVRDHGAEARPLAQVHPRAEDPPGGHRDVLVPRLGVDPARGAAGAVEGDVVLHERGVRQARGHGLGALPVLLEPAAVVPVDGQLHEQQPVDGGGVHGEVLGVHCPAFR